MATNETITTDQAEDERRMVIERCAKRAEAYAVSLELRRHMGLPDPVAAVSDVAAKLRAL